MAVTISLPDSQKEFIERQMAAKGFNDASEYLQSLVSDAQEHERLEELLLEGLAGGTDIPLTPEFWQGLMHEAQQIASDHKRQ